jgi:UPF0755 protein
MNILKFLLYWIFCSVLILSFTTYEWFKFLEKPLIAPGISVSYELTPKMSMYGFTHGLYQMGVLSLKNRSFFVLLVYVRGDAHRLKTGEYLLQGGKTPDEVLKKLVRGEVIFRHITFLEGWNFRQMLAAIQSNNYLRHTLFGLTPPQIMSKLGYAGVAPEGRFFPDTYFFTRGTPDTLILKKAFVLMQQRLGVAWSHRNAQVNYKTPYEALIAASIIEKESGFKLERPIIAGVLLNRVRKGMPLQIDSTVSYGLGGTVHLTQADLLRPTMYNTYLRKGWPPTPIAMPSLNAIQAALHPKNNAFIYFVATGTTGHHFSITLKEHHAAVAHYKLKIRKFDVTLMPYLLPEIFVTSAPFYLVALKFPYWNRTYDTSISR